jgi:DNA-binding response OmpR family regulator
MSISEALSARPLILVVERTDTLRELLARALLGAGFHAVTAADGSEAIALLDSLDVDPDVAVLDRLGGEQVAAELFRRHPALPTIFISAHTEEPDTELPGLLLEKPFRLRVLCNLVTHVLARHPLSLILHPAY